MTGEPGGGTVGLDPRTKAPCLPKGLALLIHALRTQEGTRHGSTKLPNGEGTDAEQPEAGAFQTS